MPCSSSSRSQACLHFSGSPTNSGTMWVSLDITGRPAAVEDRLDAGGAVLVALALPVRGLQVADRGGRGRADRRRQRGGEDEARRIGAHGVDDLGLAGDIAAEAAERLGQRAFEHVDAVHDAVALGDAAAARAVHADRMHLVDIGHGAVALGEIADLRPAARRRRPSNRGFRRRSAWAGRDRRRSAAPPDARCRCGGRSAARSRPGGRPRSSNCG